MKHNKNMLKTQLLNDYNVNDLIKEYLQNYDWEIVKEILYETDKIKNLDEIVTYVFNNRNEFILENLDDIMFYFDIKVSTSKMKYWLKIQSGSNDLKIIYKVISRCKISKRALDLMLEDNINSYLKKDKIKDTNNIITFLSHAKKKNNIIKNKTKFTITPIVEIYSNNILLNPCDLLEYIEFLSKEDIVKLVYLAFKRSHVFELCYILENLILNTLTKKEKELVSIILNRLNNQDIISNFSLKSFLKIQKYFNNQRVLQILRLYKELQGLNIIIEELKSLSKQKRCTEDNINSMKNLVEILKESKKELENKISIEMECSKLNDEEYYSRQERKIKWEYLRKLKKLEEERKELLRYKLDKEKFLQEKIDKSFELYDMQLEMKRQKLNSKNK